MPRLRLYDIKLSRLPELIGKCQGDTNSIANYVNSAQRRLLMCREAGDEGWWGTWAEVAFTLVSRNNPYITCPREVARIERIQVCDAPVRIQNQFYEYLDFGNGRMPKTHFTDSQCLPMGYTRNNAITFREFTGPKKIRIYWTDLADIQSNKRVFIQGTDGNDTTIYSLDGFMNVRGIFVSPDQPFAETPMAVKTLTGIQKDPTIGEVQIFEVDPTTGTETLILTMQPGEMVAGYRRYYLGHLPTACCLPSNTVQSLQVTAIVKLELIPVQVDTDYLLLQNLEAVIEECCSVRYSEIDSESAKQMAQEKHQQAVRLLQGELVHYLGKDRPAVMFSPFGSARLSRQKIGTLI